MKHVRMNDLREDFQWLREPRPGTIEILIAISYEHTPIASSLQGLPVMFVTEQVYLFKRTRNIKATRRNKYYVGIFRSQFSPGHPRGMLEEINLLSDKHD